MITKQEKIERQKAVQFAIDNNRLEGLEVSQEFIYIAQEWIDGKLTDDEFGGKVYEVHGIRSISG